MPTSCVAFGCSNTMIKPDCIWRNVSFHRFPHRDAKLMKVWLLNLRRKDFIPTKASKICSDHFDPKYFIRQGKNMVRILKKGAVPTLFSYSDPVLKKKTPSTVRFVMRYKENDTLTPEDVPPKISSVKCIEQLQYDKMDQLSGDSEETPAGKVHSLFSYSDPVLKKKTPSTVRFVMRYKENDTLTPEDVLPKISSVKCIEQLQYDEMDQLSGDSEETPAGKVQPISTEDPINIAGMFSERPINENLILPIRIKNFSFSKKLREEAKSISALKNEQISKVIERSMKRTMLELEIKAANARRDYYEKKKSSLSLRSDLNTLKKRQISLTEQKILENLRAEESAFNTEKRVLKSLLFWAERQAATSEETYREMKKPVLLIPNPAIVPSSL